jgi:hypothetical protein
VFGRLGTVAQQFLEDVEAIAEGRTIRHQ